MISSLRIRGYRGFEDFEMSGLERVNLFVGSNNSGKTSVLEAIHLLTSRGDPWSLWQVLQRRGERPAGERNASRPPEVDVTHLFRGHDVQVGSKFNLDSQNQESLERHLSIAISEAPIEQAAPPASRQGSTREAVIPSRMVLHVKGQPEPPISMIPITRAFGLSSDVLDSPHRIRRRAGSDGNVDVPVQFITTESLSGAELVSLWDTVALTPNEERVLVALRYLDSRIERIAAQATQVWGGRGGFIVKTSEREHPVPIGSLGDGIWRMLAIAIAIAHCRHGALLIDEIDTGLHYTVMKNMWALVVGAALDLDVQVFATSHSSDCIKSLAELCFQETTAADNVSLQRIESGKPKAVPYTAEEIEIAAERQIEVR
jgi:predicted ATPase